jgi:hypothetical protein
MALIIQGKLHFTGKVQDFKQQMHPDSNLSLEDSYLKYIRSLDTEGVDNEN